MSTRAATATEGKVLKGCLIACLVIAGLGILGLAAVGYFGYRFVKSRVATTPEEALEWARGIMDFEIPGGAKGVFAVDLGFRMATVQDSAEPPQVLLILGSFPAGWTGDARQAFEQAMRQSAQGPEDMAVQQTATQHATICGQLVSVEVKRGILQTKAGPTPVTAYQSLLERPQGAIFLMLIGTGPAREANVASVFRSLQCKDSSGQAELEGFPTSEQAKAPVSPGESPRVKTGKAATPEEALKWIEEILEFDIPGGVKGLFAMDLGFRIAAVQDATDPPRVFLIVARFPTNWTGDPRAAVDETIRRSAQMPGKMTIDKRYPQRGSLCGQEVNVEVKHGVTQTKTGPTPVTMWDAFLERSEGRMLVVAMATGPSRDTNASSLFRSLRCKK